MARGECNRAAPDAQPSANAKKDYLTIRAGMACKMITIGSCVVI